MLALHLSHCLEGILIFYKLLFSSCTDMKEGQKDCEGGKPALDWSMSQRSKPISQPVQDSTVPVPVSRVMVEVEIYMHLYKAQIVHLSHQDIKGISVSV